MISINTKAIMMLACDFNCSYKDIRLAIYEIEDKGIPSLMLMPTQLEFIQEMNLQINKIVSCGYPAGCQPLESKLVEIKQAVEIGADEIFAVPLNAYILDREYDQLDMELKSFVEAAQGCPVTLIVEQEAFDEDQVRELCTHAKAAGIHGIATSAAFEANSIFSITDPLALAKHVCTTSPESVSQIRKWIGNSMEIVAADAYMDMEKANKLLEAGADRICSPTILSIL